MSEESRLGREQIVTASYGALLSGVVADLVPPVCPATEHAVGSRLSGGQRLSERVRCPRLVFLFPLPLVIRLSREQRRGMCLLELVVQCHL
jgi:hypothetical protein